jgi:Arc/MetJ-type ribon-helix-helix transcriptional regulator
MKRKKYTTVSLPTPLVEKIKKRIKNTGFKSVSDYVTFVLRELISSLEEKEKKRVYSKEDEEKIKARLRALGYI